MTHRIDANNLPADRDLVFSWERGLDPWHPDAFPPELQRRWHPKGKRTEGWLGLDWAGNAILFICDGEYKDRP